MQTFADFFHFVVKTLQRALTESEKITAGSFIFRAESGSIGGNASNPVCGVAHTPQKIRKTEQLFDGAIRDHAQLKCMVEFQKNPFLVFTDVGEIDE